MRMNEITSQKIGERLLEFGYKPEELQLLFLVPFVQMAWAEGFVQPIERRAILKLAARLNVTPQHMHHPDLLEWLDERPPDAFFQQTNEILREMLDILPPYQSLRLRRMLEAGCFKVAHAAGDIGFFKKRSRITPEEREEFYRLGELLNFSLNRESKMNDKIGFAPAR